MLLKHIILSHHGEYEFGSPKRPKIQEAIIINYLDDLSAKINNFQATLKKENVGEGEWTAYSKMHDRYLYRQTGYAGSGSVPAGDLEDAEEAKHAGRRESETNGEDLRAMVLRVFGKLPLTSRCTRSPNLWILNVNLQLV
jgi:3'-5' exoribonuclease